MTATQEVLLLLWLNINVLFVFWRICRATAKGEICLAAVKS